MWPASEVADDASDHVASHYYAALDPDWVEDSDPAGCPYTDPDGFHCPRIPVGNCFDSDYPIVDLGIMDYQFYILYHPNRKREHTLILQSTTTTSGLEHGRSIPSVRLVRSFIKRIPHNSTAPASPTPWRSPASRPIQILGHRILSLTAQINFRLLLLLLLHLRLALVLECRPHRQLASLEHGSVLLDGRRGAALFGELQETESAIQDDAQDVAEFGEMGAHFGWRCAVLDVADVDAAVGRRRITHHLVEIHGAGCWAGGGLVARARIRMKAEMAKEDINFTFRIILFREYSPTVLHLIVNIKECSSVYLKCFNYIFRIVLICKNKHNTIRVFESTMRQCGFRPRRIEYRIEYE